MERDAEQVSINAVFCAVLVDVVRQTVNLSSMGLIEGDQGCQYDNDGEFADQTGYCGKEVQNERQNDVSVV